jgi:hypothetical protein
MSAQRLSGKVGESNSSIGYSEDEEDGLSSSEEDASVADQSVEGRKRGMPLTMPPAKRSRFILPSSDQKKESQEDTPIVKKVISAPSHVVSPQDSEDQDDYSSTLRKHDRIEMMQQSLVVSEVASKLESHIKKAMKEKGMSRSRRGGSGIVTPPFGTTGRFTMNDLITYDDEYGILDEGGSLAVVSETDDSMSFEDSDSVENDTSTVPVDDVEIVKRVRFEILRRATVENEEVIRSCANVAAFLMLTAPNEEADECCPKIVELLMTSRQLEGEFYFYRAALHPTLLLGPTVVHHHFTEKHSVSLRKSFAGGSDRSEALREFKIFSVNLIYKLLGLNRSFSIEEPLSGEDRAILLRTAKSWSKTVGIGA